MEEKNKRNMQEEKNNPRVGINSMQGKQKQKEKENEECPLCEISGDTLEILKKSKKADKQNKEETK